MSQAQFQRESQRLGELASPTAPTAAFFLLSAWGNLALFVAILAACFSVSVAPSAATSAAIASFSADSAVHGADPASDCPGVGNAPSRRTAEQPALESECDDLDADTEATSAGTLSLELSPRPSLLEKAPNPGTLLPAAHLRVSVGFARGPPAVT